MACGPRRVGGGARSGARTRGGVPARPELGDDGRVPRVREREKGGKGRSGLGRELGRRKGTGPRERFLGRGMKEEKKRWVGLKEREKEK